MFQSREGARPIGLQVHDRSRIEKFSFIRRDINFVEYLNTNRDYSYLPRCQGLSKRIFLRHSEGGCMSQGGDCRRRTHLLTKCRPFVWHPAYRVPSCKSNIFFTPPLRIFGGEALRNKSCLIGTSAHHQFPPRIEINHAPHLHFSCC